MKFSPWCLGVDMHRYTVKCFRLAVVLRHLGLVSRAFHVEAALFLRMLRITADGLICHFIATCPFLPPLRSHLCTTLSRLYYYVRSFLIVAVFAVVRFFFLR